MKDPDLKTCGICGKDFACNQNQIEKCICREIVLNDEAINYLKTNYSDCLCPQCLALIAEKFNVGKV